MKVLITGSTGLVGGEIVKLCHEQGYSVNYLSRKKEGLSKDENFKGFYWNIDTGEIDLNCFNDVNVIIHLAGASIAKKWTKSYKEDIINSRVESARMIFKALKDNPNQVEHFITASAIGIYEDSILNYYKEDATNLSTSFLGDVVNVWENAADAFTQLNINVAKVRIGLVLDKNSGALPQIVRPVKMGLGAALGNGRQWQSWIHVKDLAGIFLHILDHELTGVYNGVSPAPVTNYQMTKKLAESFKMPFFMPKVPSFFLKLILGEMHILLLESQRVCSTKIVDAGFVFKYHNLCSALKAIYKKD